VPNLVLFSFPFLASISVRSLPRHAALIWTAVIGYLFLPERFVIDLPGLPPVNKTVILTLTLLAVVVITRPEKVRDKNGKLVDPVQLVNASWLMGLMILGLIALLFIGPYFTIQANGERLVFGLTVLPGTTMKDLPGTLLALLVPVALFLIARRHLSSPEAHRTMLYVVAACSVGYSLFMLIEFRMSPMMNYWVYGYHQHSFLQHIRGGYRPKVFLAHGLSVGMLLVMASLAAFALARIAEDKEMRLRWLMAGIWLLMMTVLSRNLGATMLALAFTPLLFLGSALRVLAVVTVAAGFLMYPVVRASDAVPFDKFVAAIEVISHERAQSLEFRLVNEEELLARANEKPLTGWGGWGRNRIYNRVGKDISVTDGLWIIQLGVGGWLRYISFFGLLCLPLLMLRWAARRKPVPLETVTLGLIMAANLVYLIPNSALSVLGWLMSGALAGFIQFDEKRVGAEEAEAGADAAPSGRRRRLLTRTPEDTPPSPPRDRGPGRTREDKRRRYSRFGESGAPATLRTRGT